MGSNETTKFRYIGVELKQENVIIMGQKKYVEGITMVRKEVYCGDRKLKVAEATLYRPTELDSTAHKTRFGFWGGCSQPGGR